MFQTTNQYICLMAHQIYQLQVTELVPPSLAMWDLLHCEEWQHLGLTSRLYGENLLQY